MRLPLILLLLLFSVRLSAQDVIVKKEKAMRSERAT